MTKKGSSINFITYGGIENIAFLLCYLLGLIRMILFLNRVSDSGIGYYAYAFELYHLIYIFIALGISKSMSIQIARRHMRQQHKNKNKVFRYTLFRVSILSILGCVLMLLFSKSLSKLLFQPNINLCIKCLAFSIVPASLFTVFGHFFDSIQIKMPYQIARIISHIINLIFTLLFSGVLYQYGSKVSALLLDDDKKNAFGSAAGALGVLMGSLFGLLFLVFCMIAFRKMLIKQQKEDNTKSIESTNSIALLTEQYNVTVLGKLLFTQGALFFLQLIYYFFGKTKEISQASGFGIFYGKVYILLFFPIILTFFMEKFATKNITKLISNEEYSHARKKMEQYLKELLVTVLPLCAIICFLAEPILNLLYKGNIKIAVLLCQKGVLLVLLYSFLAIMNSALLGMQKKGFLLLAQGIAFFVQLLSYMLFFVRLSDSLSGLIYAIAVGLLVQLIMEYVYIYLKLRFVPDPVMTIAMPIICGAIVSLFNYLLVKYAGASLGEFITVLLGSVLTFVIYSILLMVTHTLTVNEWNEVPFGKYFILLGNILGLIR